MTVKLYAFTCGTVTGEFAHLMEGGVVGEAHPKAMLARLDAACRGIGLDDRPTHLLRCRKRDRERLLGRERERQRGKIGITVLLQSGGFGASIGRGVTVLRFAQLDYSNKGRGTVGVARVSVGMARSHTRCAIPTSGPAAACHSGNMGLELCYLPDVPSVLRALACSQSWEAGRPAKDPARHLRRPHLARDAVVTCGLRAAGARPRRGRAPRSAVDRRRPTRRGAAPACFRDSRSPSGRAPRYRAVRSAPCVPFRANHTISR